VPWIAFLSENDYVQNGIYPVYLYYKENDLLILAYGVSEKNIPKNKWGLLKGKLIQDYFSENNLGNPEKYGNSYVFKTYNTKEPLIDINIDKDLQKIISTYNNIQRNLSVPQKNFIHLNLTQQLDMQDCMSHIRFKPVLSPLSLQSHL
jgi:5-methylcytosine-specific restriction protein B